MTNKLDKFLSKRGQICSLSINRPLKLRKGIEGSLLKKQKVINVRAGVSYKNIKAIRESGIEPKKLPYGKWVKYPHIIEHNGGLQYRFSTLTNTEKHITYLYNGEEISEERARELAPAGEFGKTPTVFNVKEENLEEIM
jgi:hypothetical protein